MKSPHDLIDLKTPKIILLVGKPKSGKSNAIKSILLENVNPKKDLVLVFSGNNDTYDYVDKDFVVTLFNESILKRFIKFCRKNKINNYIVFDDQIGIITNQNRYLMNLFSTHRHSHSNIILATQHLKQGSSTILREIVNYAFVFFSNRKDTIMSLYEEIGQLFDNLEEFKKRFREVTEKKYMSMFYDADSRFKDETYIQVKFPDMSKSKKKIMFRSEKKPTNNFSILQILDLL